MTPNGRDDSHSSSNDASPSEESPSSDKPDESPIRRQRSPGIDADLARMEALLDSWCLDLKRNVLVNITLKIKYLSYKTSAGQYPGLQRFYFTSCGFITASISECDRLLFKTANAGAIIIKLSLDPRVPGASEI